MNIEKIKELKKLIEECIFKMCEEFEDDTGLEIQDIGMVKVDPCLTLNIKEKEYEEFKKAKPKLISISLDIRIT